MTTYCMYSIHCGNLVRYRRFSCGFRLFFPAILWFAIAFYETSAYFLFFFIECLSYLIEKFSQFNEIQPSTIILFLIGTSNVIWCSMPLLSINNNSLFFHFTSISKNHPDDNIKHIFIDCHMFIESYTIFDDHKSLWILTQKKTIYYKKPIS